MLGLLAQVPRRRQEEAKCFVQVGPVKSLPDSMNPESFLRERHDLGDLNAWAILFYVLTLKRANFANGVKQSERPASNIAN